MTSLARVLFDTPHVMLWLSENHGADRAGSEDGPALAQEWLATLQAEDLLERGVHDGAFYLSEPLVTTQRVAIGTLHLAFGEPRPACDSGLDQQRVNALADIAADLLEARRGLRLGEDALSEQELLTAEADHRVANGLQLLHNALLLQAGLENHSEARAALRTAARRVSAVARAHVHIHQTPAKDLRGGSPDVATYLGALLNDISQQPGTDEDSSSAQRRSIALQVDPDATAALPTSLLPRLGLIAAELVANALKHGAGPITVAVWCDASTGGIGISVSDLGPGFPADFVLKARSGKGLGMRLVTALSGPGGAWIDPANRRCIVVQLGGSLRTG